MNHGKGHPLTHLDRSRLKADCPPYLLVSSLTRAGVIRPSEWINARFCAWQIGRGQLIIRPRPTAVPALLHEAVDRWQETVVQRRLWLDLILPGSTPRKGMWWNLDRTYFSLALHHLLRNAINFTPAGGTITLRLAHLAGDRLHIELADTGIGIPVEQHELIFEKFYRVSQAQSRITGQARLRNAGRAGGVGQTAGLGLYLVRGIIEAHDGRIWVERNDDGGTTFKLQLPRLPEWSDGDV